MFLNITKNTRLKLENTTNCKPINSTNISNIFRIRSK